MNNQNNINTIKNDYNDQDSNLYLNSRKLKDIPNNEFTDFIATLDVIGLKELKKSIENANCDNKKIGLFNT